MKKVVLGAQDSRQQVSNKQLGSLGMEEKKNRSPEEQEAAFKSWLQNKTLRDTTFAYLEKLDPIHAREEENLKQVAVALRAAERVLGDSDGGDGGDDYGDPEAAPKVRGNCHLLSIVVGICFLLPTGPGPTPLPSLQWKLTTNSLFLYPSLSYINS